MDFEYNLLYSNGLDTVSSSHYPSGLHLCFIQRHLFSDLHISLAMEPALSLHWCSAHLDCKEIKPVSPAAAAAAAAAAKLLQSCPTLCDPIDGSLPGSLVPEILKNTGVGCHFLLQCMKVKSKSEVAQSCPTLCDPMDCSLAGSSARGIFQARVLKWVAIAFSIL